MGWKDWSFKTKGALIGGVIGGVYFITLYSGYQLEILIQQLYRFISYPIVFLRSIMLWVPIGLESIGFNLPYGFTFNLIFDLVILIEVVLLGMLIGWTYGKITCLKN